MQAITTIEGQGRLPRRFAAVFAAAGRIEAGRLDIVLPDGRRFRARGRRPGPAAELWVHDSELFARLAREGDLGFCEAYLDGAWSSPDLQALMDLLHAAGDGVYDGFRGIAILRAFERARHALRRNSRRQARRNVGAHYDLGNAFYALWLDDTMTYSSARFATGQESLEAAQTAKYASLVNAMGVKPGDHVLEIGCGWGGFAEYAAAKRGLRVTGLTISPAQQRYAAERIAAAGLCRQVEIRLRDYRDERGRYDAVASIEMFEAVGQRHWPVYFDALRERLRPGRRAGLQIITVCDRRWEVYRRGVDFIRKHVFPGGMLPSRTALLGEVEHAGLVFARSVEFGDSYSQTLRRWQQRFNERWDEIARLGFDERFRRLWTLYLTSCAASFASGNTDVTQITVERPA
jgi:cyclopropane-fatty-acyl-phospholipid synthase